MRKIKNNKKGVAEVVGMVFIIGITIVSVGILFSAVRSITLAPEESLSCAEVQIDVPITIEGACYNQETNEAELTLKRNIVSEINVVKLDFSISSESGNVKFECGPTCGGGCVILESGTKTYYFNVEDLTSPQTATFKVNGCALESTEILPTC